MTKQIKTKQINMKFTLDIHRKLKAKAAEYGNEIKEPCPVTTFCKLKLKEIANAS